MIDIRIGTRGSNLAMTQARWVQSQLGQCGVSAELVIIKTEGDVRSGSLKTMGGQGAFTRRIQDALIDRQVDLAVHSLKDLPTQPNDRLMLAAVPMREDERDALVSARAKNWRALPPGAIVGTGSPRRVTAIKHLRPDLDVRDIRGNLDTRLSKLDAGQYDALILACAGLQRLGWQDRIAYRFSVEEFPPAAGQGALGLECRSDDVATQQAVEVLNDRGARARVDAERAVLRHLQAGCLAPIGVATSVDLAADRLSIAATLYSDDGMRRVDRTATGSLDQAHALGVQVAEGLLESGLHFPKIDPK